MQSVLPRAAFALLLLVVLATPAVADAGVSAFWRPLGTSASGNGISQTPSPRTVFDASLAVGDDGRPVVAYTEYPNAVAARGAITVKRWTGSAWQTLSGAGGIGQGYQPQVRISAAGAIYVAWLTDGDDGNTEIRLRVRTTTTFSALGESDSPGGISATNPGITGPISLALDGSGNPIVAFVGAAQTDNIEVDETPALLAGTAQIYVRRWTGRAWEFLGSDFAGGGASNALSFASGGDTIVHIADAPSLVIDSNGDPVVAFTYFTTVNSLLANTDIYVTRWNGATWTAVGPPVPQQDTAAGIGGGGVSDSETGSFNPSLAPDAAGRLALAWEEDTPTGATYVWVRVWNGVDAWEELAGSATGSGFTPAETLNTLPQIAVDPDGNPIVAWQALADFAARTQVYVLRWNGAGAWDEMPLASDSARNAGISDAVLDAMAPALAVTPPGGPAEAGVPTVAWLDSRDTGTFQIFLRQFLPPDANMLLTASADLRRYTLKVAAATPAGATGQGGVGTIGGPFVACAYPGPCSTIIPHGTRVSLVASPEPGNRFLNWMGGPCSGRTTATCEFTQTTNAATTALFRAVTGVQVLKVGSGAGTVTGTGVSCGADCSHNVFTGTTVRLTPTAAGGSHFVGWSGDACDGRAAGACVFTATGLTRTITATFTRNRHSLAIVSHPRGGVTSLSPDGTIQCGNGNSACSAIFDYGTPVVLRAMPNEGFSFVNWTGVGCAGGATNATCAFALRANVTVKPTYRARTVVTVLKDGNGAGTVTGPGVRCGADCSGVMFDRRTVILTATATAGSRFLGFGGACVSAGPTCTFVPAGNNQTVSATFQLNSYTVTVTERANGAVANLNALPDPVACGAGGTDCRMTLDFGTPVTLRATPIGGSVFVNWTGSVCNSRKTVTCSFTIPAGNVSVAPRFRDVTSLSLNKTGMGTVTSSPAGISCGPTCSAAAFDFDRRALIRLTPRPAVGWSFDGFSGACSGATCTVNASPISAFVGASFSIQSRWLKVTVAGNGRVSGSGFSCDPGPTPCAQAFDYGTKLPLTPTPAAGHRFTGWSGGCTGADACRPLMTVNRSVTATFRPIFGLEVSRTGNSHSGAITSSPAGINCGVATTDCSHTYLAGTLVTLTRSAPVTGTVFRWLGACASRGTSPTCALRMNANTSVVGEYRRRPLHLTVNRIGPLFGRVSRVGGALDCGADCVEVVDYGTPVTLLATPSADPASEFVSWTGCTPATNLSCTFPLRASRTVTATFRPRVAGITLQTLSAGPLGVGGTRQITALATFTDARVQDVTAQSTWSSNAPTIATVNASGLVTARVLGSAGVVAKFRGVTSDPLVVEVDRLIAEANVVAPRPRAIVVECSPYGESTVDASRLACLPSGRRFEVHCRATGRFAGDPDTDVDITEQVRWVSTSTTIATSTGLVALSGPVRQSFRINAAGIARLYARMGSHTSLTTGNLKTDPWVVEGRPQTLTGPPQIQPATPSVQVDGDPVQLRATATLTGTGTCQAPPQRDFSLLVDWRSADESTAEVSFFGAVTGVAAGTTGISATYGIMGPVTVPLSVTP